MEVLPGQTQSSAYTSALIHSINQTHNAATIGSFDLLAVHTVLHRLAGLAQFKAVMALDSAYCSRSHRSGFLSLLQSDEFFCSEPVLVSGSRKLLRLLERFCKKLRSVTLKGYFSKQIEQVKAHCRNLKDFNVTCYQRDIAALRVILENNTHIECLTISNEYGVVCFPSFKDIVLPHLSTLAVKKFKIDSENIVDLMKQGSIVRLDLNHCRIVPATLFLIARACPLLRVLKLVTTGGITDETSSSFTNIAYTLCI